MSPGEPQVYSVPPISTCIGMLSTDGRPSDNAAEISAVASVKIRYVPIISCTRYSLGKPPKVRLPWVSSFQHTAWSCRTGDLRSQETDIRWNERRSALSCRADTRDLPAWDRGEADRKGRPSLQAMNGGRS